MGSIGVDAIRGSLAQHNRADFWPTLATVVIVGAVIVSVRLWREGQVLSEIKQIAVGH